MSSRAPRLLPLLAFAAALAVAGCNRTDNLTEAEHLQRAAEFHAKKDDKSAIVEAKNALQKNPKSAEARILLAEIYLAQNAGRSAQNEIEIAIQRGANAARLKLLLARAYMLQSNFERAAATAKITLATPAVDRAGLLEVEARARMAMQQYGLACSLFDDARKADPKFIKAYVGSAMCASAQGRSVEAMQIVDKAIEVDPKDPEGWVLKGDMDRLARRYEPAEKSYTKALELKKTSVEALLGRALVYADTNRLKEAEADTATLSRVYRGQPLINYVTGIVRFRQGRFAEARTAFETTLTTAPTHFPTILWLGLTNYAMANYAVAEKQLNQYVTLLPNSPKVRALLALARARAGGSQQAAVDVGELARMDLKDPQTLAMIGETHAYLGNPALGSQFLAKSVELAPKAADARVALAASLLENKDVDGALAQLKTVLADAPDNVPAAELQIQALVAKKDYAGAMREAQALVQRSPDNPVAGNYVGSVALLLGDEPAARGAFEKVLSKTPGFFPAANNLALMALKANKPDDAVSVYRRFLDKTPNSLPALLALHRLERARGRGAEAEKALLQAAQSHPAEVLPAQMLAQSYLSSGRPRKAVDATDPAARAHPDDAGLLEVRGLAYLALGEPANAVPPLKKLTQIKGDSADAFVYYSAAQTALGDRPAAKAALDQALVLDPLSYSARLARGRIAVTEGRFEEAIATSRALAKQKPDDVAPVLLEASALVEGKKTGDALRLVKPLVARFPQSSDVRLALARAYVASGDNAGAMVALDDWRRADPKNAIPLEALAELYYGMGKETEAIAAYRSELQLRPSDPRALNNLAFLLRKRDPKEALVLAQKAVDLVPNDANVLDTRGQIESELGNLKDSVATFRKANEIAPKSTRIRFHLASALAKAGDKTQAKRELERLLAGDARFDDAGEARSLLGQLSKQ